MTSIEELLRRGTCLKKIGSVRTYRVVEYVDGPYVHTRKPNDVPERLNVEGLLDIWEVGVDSRREEGAMVADSLRRSAALREIACDAVTLLERSASAEERRAAKELRHRLEDVHAD